MKSSDLRKLYLSVINLYGFVYSYELFEILDHYKIKYKKEQILKDLEDRSTKMTKYYYVQKMKHSYLIINPEYSNEEFQELESLKENKPRYYPKTYDDLLKYSYFSYKDDEQTNGFMNLFTFLKRHFDKDENDVALVTEFIMLSMKKSVNNGLSNSFKFLEYFGFKWPNEKVASKYLKVYQNVNNNLRTPSNNGFTPVEMRRICGPIDMNNVTLTIGPNMRENFMNGTSDPYEYLKELNGSDLPESARESMTKELLEIINEIKNTPKA